MYTGHGFNDWGIGDVDVLKVGDTYHLFHLVLPNHAYIAHATSKDGLTWTRVRNALFIGDPGAWDDDMLWTMHISPDPQQAGRWRMFYTGLCRKEHGRIQRVGLAVSDDLYAWQKVKNGAWPITVKPPHYEAAVEQGRHWVSFRDPYYTRVNGEGWLIASARVPSGPVNRRGGVWLAKETAPGTFEPQPPLVAFHLYDDIEVPSLANIAGMWYLIGSVREDIKVHYWHAGQPTGPYESFTDNVLLPAGNYAARLCVEAHALTVWNFFYVESRIKGAGNMLPPPKELIARPDGQLALRSYRGFDRIVTRTHAMKDLTPLRMLGDNPAADNRCDGDSCRFGCKAAFEIFLVRDTYRNFRLSGTLEMEGEGKCGFVLRLNEESDGYFVSLELVKGLAQIRAWGNNPGGSIEEAFIYRPLQANYFVTEGLRPYTFQLIAFGDYIELSIDGCVMLSLADDTYREGAVGFYTESAFLRIDDLVLDELPDFEGETWGGTDDLPQD